MQTIQLSGLQRHLLSGCSQRPGAVFHEIVQLPESDTGSHFLGILLEVLLPPCDTRRSEIAKRTNSQKVQRKLRE